MTAVVKILRAEEWAMFVADGAFAGSPDDLRDGYIHLSPPDQVSSTIARWFAGSSGLIAVTFDADGFGPDLRWEAARGGILFPHVYRPLRLGEVIETAPS